MTSSPETNTRWEKISKILVFTTPLFCVAYILWVRFSIPLIFYIDYYQSLSYIFTLIIITSYIFTLAIITHLNKSRSKTLGLILLFAFMPFCCLSSYFSLYNPIILDSDVIGDMTYYLTGKLDAFDPRTDHQLYECTNSRFLCVQTPFWEGGGASFRPLQLMVDEKGNPNEINVTWTAPLGEIVFLDYTYGKQPRYYDYPAQFNNRQYYLAHIHNTSPQPNTYLLYECRLDNTFCKQLPIKYEGFGSFRDTRVNEVTGEINVYIDDQMDQETLIFSWGENPRCYIDGCVILGDAN